MPAVRMDQQNKDHNFNDIFKKFQNVTNEPDQYLTAQPKKCDTILDLLQEVYQITTDSETSKTKSPLILPQLITEDMDEEQVWQQLEMRNDVVLPTLLEETSKLLALQEQKLEIRLKEDENDGEEAENEHDDEEKADHNQSDDNDDENDQEDSDEDENKLNNVKIKKKYRKSIVDDKFFKLSEMEEFLEAEEEKDKRKRKGKPKLEDDDGIDYFADELEDNEGDSEEDEDAVYNVKYGDFFDADESDENKKGSAKRKQKGKDHFANYEEAEEEEYAEEKEKEDIENSDNEEDEEGSDNEGIDVKDSNNEGSDSEDDDDDDDDNNAEQEGKINAKSNRANDLEPASDSDSDTNAKNDDKPSQKEDDDEKPKSSFQLRQERLQKRIHEYEEKLLGEKPWQMKGEILATNRPQNSLLEEILEFDAAVRPAPLITEETTKCLEDIIKQRIKDQAWDDVVRKVRPIHTPQEYRKQLVLDQEKSKESLAQIYEKEYQREIDKLKPQNLDDTIVEESKEHQEIRRLMQTLFVKLDALSNFHFTPKPIAPEPKIITNTPAIAMEEVAPIAVSDANLLAPEEVYRGPKYELVGKSERNRTDKNRERRKKKAKQRAINKIQEEKDTRRQKLGIPLSRKEEKDKLLKKLTKQRNVEKLTATDDKKALKSSKAFFSQLQDNKTTTAKTPKRKADPKTLSAKKLKL